MDTVIAIQQLKKFVNSLFSKEDLTDLFLIDIVVTKPNYIEIFIDSDKALDLNLCSIINRDVQEFLDKNLLFGDDYTLDVSSPGIDRPLTFKRQYHKNIGRSLEIVLTDKTALTGKLVKIEKDVLLIEKKDKKTIVNIEVPIESIEKALVIVSFK